MKKLEDDFMEYAIVRVDKDNYTMFDEMIFYRENNRERNEYEKNEAHDFSTVYETLTNENLYVYAAQYKNIFVGWISIVYIPKVSWTKGKGHLYIDELWVNPSYRNKGIAKALMLEADKLVMNAAKPNILGIRLYVDANNEEALPLYKKCGYRGVNDDAVFMEKEL